MFLIPLTFTETGANITLLFPSQDVEIKEEGTRHMLILYNVRMDMAGPVDFSAANAKSNAQLRVKCESIFISQFLLSLQTFVVLVASQKIWNNCCLLQFTPQISLLLFSNWV